MTVEALEAEDSVISESLELSKSPFSSFKIARTTSKNESEKEVEYSMDENFENDDEGSMDVEKSKIAFSKQFIDSTNRPKVAQNLQNKMSRNDISDNEKEDEYLDSFIEDDDELVLGGQKFREKADTKKNENDFRLSESFQEIDEDDEVEEKVVKKGGKEKDTRMRAIEEDNYEKEVDEVEDEDDTFRSNNLSRTTLSQGGGFGAQIGRNLGSKSLPYPSRIDEDEEVEDEDEEIERERERGYGMSVVGGSGKGKGKGSIKEVEEDGEEEDDYECSYSRDFEQSRSARMQLINIITSLCVVFLI
jgi:hypothetical protein